MNVANVLRRLFRRRPLPTYQVGDMVRFRGRAWAISRVDRDAAELIWIDEARNLHTAGFVPVTKLESYHSGN